MGHLNYSISVTRRNFQKNRFTFSCSHRKMLETSTAGVQYTYPSLFGFELDAVGAPPQGWTDSEETHRLLVPTSRLTRTLDLRLAFSTSNG